MRYAIAVEAIEPGHYVAVVLGRSGSFSSARSEQDAVGGAPVRVAEYLAWVAVHDPSLPAVGSIEAVVSETFSAHASSEDADYLVEAIFEDDRRPLSYWDVETGLRLPNWSRQDLLEVALPPLSDRAPQAVCVGGVSRIRGIVEHVIRAGTSYLSHSSLATERPALPESTLARLEIVRSNGRGRVIEAIGEDRVREDRGEKWSARKILRRTLWHERGHTPHIAGLAAGAR